MLGPTTALGNPKALLLARGNPRDRRRRGKEQLLWQLQQVVEKEGRQTQKRTLKPQTQSSKQTPFVQFGPELWMDMLKQESLCGLYLNVSQGCHRLP